jgi:hypothetical protein
VKRNRKAVLACWLMWALASGPVFAIPGVLDIELPIDSSPQAKTIRFVPGEQRQFRVFLEEDNLPLNLTGSLTGATSSTIYLVTYNSAGTKLSSMTLAVTTPYTSGILTGITGATFITSATYYGGIVFTSGSVKLAVAPFRITPPELKSFYN